MKKSLSHSISLVVVLFLAIVVSGCATKKGRAPGAAGLGDGDATYELAGNGASETGGIGLGTLERVHFEFDQAALTSGARESLENNARVMRKRDSLRVLIEGHCDERGSNEYNIALGERRAKAAIDYMVSLGIARSRFEMKSWGEERPLDPSRSAAAYKLNRRAEFVILSR